MIIVKEKLQALRRIESAIAAAEEKIAHCSEEEKRLRLLKVTEGALSKGETSDLREFTKTIQDATADIEALQGALPQARAELEAAAQAVFDERRRALENEITQDERMEKIKFDFLANALGVLMNSIHEMGLIAFVGWNEGSPTFARAENCRRLARFIENNIQRFDAAIMQEAFGTPTPPDVEQRRRRFEELRRELNAFFEAGTAQIIMEAATVESEEPCPIQTEV